MGQFFRRDCLVKFLEACAEGAAKRTVLDERLTADGRYLVTEEWPTEADYNEVRELRQTLVSMRAVSLTLPQPYC